MNISELAKMKEGNRFSWFASHGPVVANVGRLASHHKATHVHSPGLFGAGNTHHNVWPVRLVAVPSYGIDSNAAPAFGT